MPLRPELYRRLCSRFAREGGVLIVDEDCEMQYTVGRDALTGKPRLEIAWSGEYLVINCPYCGDTRRRLWINHLWGYLHPQTHSRNLWLCCCYNEDCLRTYPRQLDLYRRVFEDVGPRRPPDPLLRGVVAPPLLPEMPGPTLPLHTLPTEHPANVYLRGRGFDPAVLSRALGVGYCERPLPRFYKAAERIIVPIVFNGRLAGWQARYVGTPPDGTAKYRTMTGTRKAQLLYNFDMARKYPFAVVCEGVSDVWRVGPAAVALFGKSLSQAQRGLVAATWRDGAAVVLLDGDAPEDGRKVYDLLANVVRHRVLVRLPGDVDPGDLSYGEIWRFIYGAAQEQGVELPLGQVVGREPVAGCSR